MAEEGQKSYEPVGGSEGIVLTVLTGETEPTDVSDFPYTPEDPAVARVLEEHPLFKEQGAPDPEPQTTEAPEPAEQAAQHEEQAPASAQAQQSSSQPQEGEG